MLGTDGTLSGLSRITGGVGSPSRSGPLFCESDLGWLGPMSDSFGGCLCLTKASPLEATDSRCGVQPYSKLRWRLTMRRILLLGLESVAVSRHVACGGY